jgi:hypothetical protein
MRKSGQPFMVMEAPPMELTIDPELLLKAALEARETGKIPDMEAVMMRHVRWTREVGMMMHFYQFILDSYKRGDEYK